MLYVTGFLQKLREVFMQPKCYYECRVSAILNIMKLHVMFCFQ